MVISPLVQRELQRAIRKRWPHRARISAALVFCLLAYFAYESSTTIPSTFASGRWLFFSISHVIILLSALSGPCLTSLALREEKRTHMLDLLLLSKVGPSGILFSKLLTFTNPTVQILLSAIPILTMPILLGGVSISEIFRMGVLCLSTLALSSFAGLFGATICRSAKSAAILSASLMLCFSLGSYSLEQLIVNPIAFAFIPGLIQALSTVSDRGNQLAPLTFWFSIQAFGFATLALALLSVQRLPLTTIERAKQEPSIRPETKKTKAKAAFRSHPRRHRSNLIHWLASKRQWNPVSSYLFMIGTAAAIVGFFYFQTWFRIPRNHLHLLVFPLLAHTVFKLMLAAKASHLITDSRKNGELEILLATPLRSRGIYSGYRTAILAAFRNVFVFVLMVDGGTLGYSHATLRYQGDDRVLWLIVWGMAIMLVIDRWAIIWIALWESCRSKNSLNTLTRTLRATTLYPLIVFIVTVSFSPVMLIYAKVLGDDSLYLGGIMWWWICGFLFKAPIAFNAKRSLSSHFRRTVSSDAVPKTSLL